jgi:hypothetical protein
MIAAKSGYAQSLDKPMAVGSKSPATAVVAFCGCGVATMSAVLDTPIHFAAEREKMELAVLEIWVRRGR